MEWVDNDDGCGNYDRQLVLKTPPAPNENLTNTIKMYVMIRRDMLTLVQCGVQAAHAIAKYVNKYNSDPKTKEWVEKHETLIFLEATQDDIIEMRMFFANMNKKEQCFSEPDLDNLLTACAFEPITATEGKIYFGKFKLLR